MAVSEQLKTLVEQMPDPDGRGMYTENIDKEKIEKAVEAIYKGGRANMQGLVEMLGEPGTAEDVKPHYALHCVLNHTLIVKDEKAQKEFCDVLAAELSGNHSNYIKSYLCQELQWAGDKSAAPALGKLLTNEELCDPAAMALVAIKGGAAEELRKAAPQAEGRCRLAVVDALAALGDSGAASIFKEALKDADREVRIAAGAGLAKLGDAGSADLLTKAADVAPGWERIQATKNCMVLAENLAASGKKSDAQKIYKHLSDTRKDPTEKYIRDAAQKAMGA
jgi:HEAT repeat protein